jgi:hypothetical protein
MTAVSSSTFKGSFREMRRRAEDLSEEGEVSGGMGVKGGGGSWGELSSAAGRDQKDLPWSVFCFFFSLNFLKGAG